MKHVAALSTFVAFLCASGCTKSVDATVVNQVCAPGTNDCNGDTLRRCNDVGSGWDIVKRCAAGTCTSGNDECGGPVMPLASTTWISCNKSSSADAIAGTMPCAPVNAGGTKVDPYEVTRSQYLAFWHATVDGKNIGGLPAACGFKEGGRGHTPDLAEWPSMKETETRLPITNIDWCDAWGYCRWAGKRLCGAANKKTYQGDAAATTATEWYAACSANGTRDHVYGDFTKGTCNDAGSVAAVGTFPGCVSPENVYDLEGNVAEMTDVCSTQANGDTCRAEGGYVNGVVGCKVHGQVNRNQRLGDVGFRCCAD